MPKWVTPEMALLAGALFLFLIVVGYLVKKVWPTIQKAVHFIDDMTGEPERPGVPARPGLMERVASIEHEVKTNHGSSLKDAVKRVEQRVEGVDNKLNGHIESTNQRRQQADQLTRTVRDEILPVAKQLGEQLEE